MRFQACLVVAMGRLVEGDSLGRLAAQQVEVLQNTLSSAGMPAASAGRARRLPAHTARAAQSCLGASQTAGYACCQATVRTREVMNGYWRSYSRRLTMFEPAVCRSQSRRARAQMNLGDFCTVRIALCCLSERYS